MSSKWKTVASMAMVLGYAGSSNAQSVDSPASIAVASSSELLRSEKSLSTQANQLNQNQWIRISDDGLIRGSISLLVGSQNVRQGKVPIALIQDGATVHETLTDVEGDFMIEKAKPGVYSLVALGENQLAICSLTVLSKKDGPHLPDRVHIRSLGPVSPRVSELLRSNTMPTWTVGSQQSSDPIAPIRTFARSCEIRIDARGGISGTLARANATVDLGSTAVYLVRDGQEVARTRASSSGAYRFENVVPGGYGLVASGREGIAAIGFTAISDDVATAAGNGDEIYVRRQDPATIPAPAAAANHLNVELAEPNCYVPSEIIPIEEQLVSEAGACCPTMGGCCGNSFSGGGGGGGGGGMGGHGGLGTWAALGALAAVAIVQADKNNNAPVVSPITP